MTINTPQELFEALKSYGVRIIVQKKNKVYIQWLDESKVMRFFFGMPQVTEEVYTILSKYPYDLRHGTGKSLEGRPSGGYMSAHKHKLYILE